jgi:hypothetical protein
MNTEIKIAPTCRSNRFADRFGQVRTGIVIVHRRDDFSAPRKRQSEPFYEPRLARINFAAEGRIPRVVVFE